MEYKDSTQIDLPLGSICFQKSLDGFHCALGDPSDFFDFEEIKKERLFWVSFFNNYSIAKYRNGKKLFTRAFLWQEDENGSMQITLL